MLTKMKKNMKIMRMEGSYQQNDTITMMKRKRMKITMTMRMRMMMTLLMTTPGAHFLIAHTHNNSNDSYNLPSKKDQTPFAKEIGREVARLQSMEHLVSPSNLITNNCTDYYKNDYHKYDMDLPLYKLDPFTTEAYVNKCVTLLKNFPT